MKQLREKNGKFTYNRPNYAKAIVIFTVIGVVVTGSIRAINEIRDIGSQGPAQNDRGEGILPMGRSNSDGSGDCSKAREGAYDCTDDATRAKVYEAAKKGIRWYTKPETKEEKLEAVCQAKGIFDNDCPRILKAMSMQESGFGKWMVGDAGRSHGFFHILNIHKDVTLECANSLTCSASWTLNRMIRNGYMQNKWHAVGTHNSYTPSVGDAYAKAVKKQLAKL